MSEHTAATDPRNSYGYVPTKWICALFVALFSITTILHVFQAVRSRTWWLIATVVSCGLLEIMGWSARLWSSINVNHRDPFLMQMVTTIIAPSFLTGGFFTLLGFIIQRIGNHYSWLTPRWYLIIFLTADISALVVQAVGGAEAALAKTPEKAEDGGQIMMYGIIVQLIAVSVYSICGGDFLWRYNWDRPVRAAEPSFVRKPKMDRKVFWILCGLGFATVLVFIRSIYRVIELDDGWNGRIIKTEVYFNVLDGAAILLAMVTLNVFNPGDLLEDPLKENGLSLAEKATTHSSQSD